MAKYDPDPCIGGGAVKIIAIVCFCLALLFVITFLKNHKRSLGNRMEKGVDIIKLTLWKIASDDFNRTYAAKGPDYCKSLAAATVNEIFGCHNPESNRIFKENQDVIVDEIRHLGINHPDLKRPITDALRVTAVTHFMSTGKPTDNQDEVFKNAMDRGVFIAGGMAPEATAFLKMAEDVGKHYEVIKE